MLNAHPNIIKCIVVDDEPLARDILRRYIEKIPSLQLVSEFANAIDASLFLREQTVDLIFLDIQMPQLTGTEFVRTLRNSPKIIFTTAHKEYAFEGFELDIVDYLLKPIRFDRFLKAVHKTMPLKQADTDQANLINEPEKNNTSFIYLRADRKMIRVLLDDIMYVESDKDYVRVFTKNGSVITRQTISSIEAMLAENKFLRIHRSFIVSLSQIKSFTNEIVEIGDKELPIGKLYRNNFLRLHGSSL